MFPLISIPKWAAANPQTARLLIIILSLFSAVLFFEFGLYLPKINFWGAIFMWSAAVLLTAYAYHSYKKGKARIKRTIIYFCLSVLWLHLGNQSLSFLSVTDSNVTVLSTASVGPIKPIAKTEKKIQKSIKKHLGKRQKQLRRLLGSYDNLSPIAAFFIFFLLALLALAIAYFLAIISCSLSCSGQVALSYVVLISAAIFALGGLFLIAYAIYRALRGQGIKNKKSTT